MTRVLAMLSAFGWFACPPQGGATSTLAADATVAAEASDTVHPPGTRAVMDSGTVPIPNGATPVDSGLPQSDADTADGDEELQQGGQPVDHDSAGNVPPAAGDAGTGAPSVVLTTVECSGGSSVVAEFFPKAQSIEFTNAIAATDPQVESTVLNCVILLDVPAVQGATLRVDGEVTYHGTVAVSEQGRGRFSHQQRLTGSQSDIEVKAFESGTVAPFQLSGEPGGSPTAECGEGAQLRLGVALRARRGTEDGQQTSVRLSRITLPAWAADPC